MKIRIVWKLFAAFATVLLLFALVAGTVFLTMFRRHTIEVNRASMEQKAVSIASTLASFQSVRGGNGMGRGGMGGYGAYLRFLNELAMADVWIVDEKLELLESGHGQMWREEIADLPENAEQIVRRVFEGEVTYGEEFSELLGTPSLTVGAPIRTGNVVTGAVLLHSPVSGVEDAVRQGVSALLGSVSAALACAGAAAFVLAYRFSRPLKQMEHAAVCMAGGDYGARASVVRRDEIGSLAGSLDLLAGKLEAAEQERASLDKLREDFVANVSHELRTPVSVLRGSVEVLLDGTVDDPAEVREYYGQMLAESRHLERLVNDLLDLSRLQDDGFRLEMGEVNLCDVSRDVCRSMRRSAQEKGLEIVLDCPEDGCLAFGDYGRVRQMLMILLDNAVKFSDGSAVRVTLTLDGARYLLCVANHGEEIPEQELAHLFDRFRKARGERNKTGTGLGLAIAKQIAGRHGADIYAESKAGETVFTVSFLVEHC